MKITDWHVMLDKSENHRLLYGPLEEFEEEYEDLHEWKDLPQEQWSDTDMYEITSALLEDVNLHKSINMFASINECILESVTNQSQRRALIMNIMNTLYLQYGSR